MGLRPWMLPSGAGAVLVLALAYASSPSTPGEGELARAWEVPVGPEPPGQGPGEGVAPGEEEWCLAPARDAQVQARTDDSSEEDSEGRGDGEAPAGVLEVPPVPALPEEEVAQEVEGLEALRDAVPPEELRGQVQGEAAPEP